MLATATLLRVVIPATAATGKIRQVTPAGQVRTLAGAPPAQYVLLRNGYTAYGDFSGDVDGRGTAARLAPNGPLVVAPDGTVYFARTNAVCRLSPQGEVTTLGGALTCMEGGYRDGTAAEARFNYLGFSDSPHGDYRDGPSPAGRIPRPGSAAWPCAQSAGRPTGR